VPRGDTFALMEIIVIAILGLAALTAVARPFFRTSNGTGPFDDGLADDSPEARAAARAELESEILRYRRALRSGTVCTRCGQANPGDSRYCADCGRPLGKSRPPEARSSAPGR